VHQVLIFKHPVTTPEVQVSCVVGLLVMIS
jgi:hypothetical protein